MRFNFITQTFGYNSATSALLKVQKRFDSISQQPTEWVTSIIVINPAWGCFEFAAAKNDKPDRPPGVVSLL